ncbi:hypothetical protein ACIA8O_15400 [Kitasatospora sp. NPDC051853]|uniref:hypothetical protein n=1 Tax=Kitasatospora sp. NPDC051853 TaxID=3364058 RepID=UPI0037B4F237
MPAVLNADASIGCGHGGTVQIVPGRRSFTAGGSPVLAAGDLEGKPITGCTQLTAGSTVQCTAVVSVTGGAAATLTVGGRPALLATLSGVTNGVPPGALVVLTPGQTTLRAR